MTETCEYGRCDGYAEPHAGGMALCYTHELEFARAITKGPASMLSFWVQARGGADAVAAEIVGKMRFGEWEEATDD